MAKYLFKALDPSITSGPGPTLWFQAPTTIVDSAAQVNGISFAANLEVTLNGTDFRSIIVGTGPVSGNIHDSIFTAGVPWAIGPADGGFVKIGQIGLIMGLRMNLLSGSATILLAIDQED